MQKLHKSFFCVLKKTQKHVIVCVYYCHSRITIDERLNGFIVCIALLYDLLLIQCADLRNLETGA